MACRFCLRQIKALRPFSNDGTAVLQYITCVIFRLRNEGPATACYRGIDNAELIPLLTIASYKEAHEALRARNRGFSTPRGALEAAANQAEAVRSESLPGLPYTWGSTPTSYAMGELRPRSSFVDSPRERKCSSGCPTVVLHFAEGSRPSLPSFFTAAHVSAPGLESPPGLTRGSPPSWFDPFGPGPASPATRPSVQASRAGSYAQPHPTSPPPGIKRQRTSVPEPCKDEVAEVEQDPRQWLPHGGINREGWTNLGYDSEDISASD